MPFLSRVNYYRRIFRSYLIPGQSPLTFWHETPQVNLSAAFDGLSEYYMPFSAKADYPGHHDSTGIPMLNYHGRIGLQYNPIAIAQWGLGNHSLYRKTQRPERKKKFLAAGDWLCVHLEPNPQGFWVWNHYFDWEYRTTLKSPWYSGLAQGQGISLLVRAYAETGSTKYLDAAKLAFRSFLVSTGEGGVSFTDESGDLWFEEYIVSPPTHILNGFIWASWGVRDFALATGDSSAHELFNRAVATLRANLPRYDLGFWSLYEESGTRLPMLASSFYHRLHIVQLQVMHRLTGERVFSDYADRWEGYAQSRSRRTRALCYKGAFKLCYY
jgi:heparosan-N-sulfate-glucuronate 5-epimerase